jgi:hypothetical protein
MANLGYIARASDYKPKTYDPLPVGWYDAIISESEIKQAANGSGHYLRIVWRVISGQYENRTVITQHTIDHHNADATEIGRNQVNGIAEAIGFDEIEDSEVLHNKPVCVYFTVKPGKGEYGPSNGFGNVKPMGGQSAKKPAASAPMKSQKSTPRSTGGSETGSAAAATAAHSGAPHGAGFRRPTAPEANPFAS